MFEFFLERYNDVLAPSPHEPILRVLEGKLPQELQDGIRAFRTPHFDSGFFCLIDPDDYAMVLREWSGIVPAGSIAFMKTGFGDLFLQLKAEYYLLRIHEGLLISLGQGADFVFDGLLTDDTYMDEVLLRSLFFRSPLHLNVDPMTEMLAFVPALCLRGSPSIDAMAIVKAREHAIILAQLQMPR